MTFRRPPAHVPGANSGTWWERKAPSSHQTNSGASPGERADSAALSLLGPHDRSHVLGVLGAKGPQATKERWLSRSPDPPNGRTVRHPCRRHVSRTKAEVLIASRHTPFAGRGLWNLRRWAWRPTAQRVAWVQRPHLTAER